MLKINDLLASAKSVCDRYEKSQKRQSVSGSCTPRLLSARRMVIACGKRRKWFRTLRSRDSEDAMRDVREIIDVVQTKGRSLRSELHRPSGVTAFAGTTRRSFNKSAFSYR